MQKVELDLETTVKNAVDFHGHLGPFLIIGVRMGLIGLGELQTSRGNQKLQATATVQHVVPYSCAIDGIQVATGCTVGNGKLKLRNAKNVLSSRFTLNGRQVTVTLKAVKFEELKKALPKEAHSYKNIQLARKIASLPEEELFTTKKK